MLGERRVLTCQKAPQRLHPRFPRLLDHAPVRSRAVPQRPQVDLGRAVLHRRSDTLADAVLSRLGVAAAQRTEPDAVPLNREVNLVQVQVQRILRVVVCVPAPVKI